MPSMQFVSLSLPSLVKGFATLTMRKTFYSAASCLDLEYVDTVYENQIAASQ